MERRCIVCGQKPTSEFTYPPNKEEAIRWQTMLACFVPVETLQHHCCVCNHHISGGRAQQCREHEEAGHERCAGDLRQKHCEQQQSVTFNKASHSFYSDDTYLLESGFKIQAKAGCTQLTKVEQLLNKENTPTSNYIDTAVLARNFGLTTEMPSSASVLSSRNSAERSWTYQPLGSRRISGSESYFNNNNKCNCAFCSASIVQKKKKTQLNIPKATSSKRTIASRQKSRQQHQPLENSECNCCLNQCPSPVDQSASSLNLESCPTDFSMPNTNTSCQSNPIDLCQKVSTNRPDRGCRPCPRAAEKSNCPNCSSPVNVLIMGGSNAPTYYNARNPTRSLTEICVLEADFTRERADFPDIDEPAFTICRAPAEQPNGIHKQPSTEVLLLGLAKNNSQYCDDDVKKELPKESQQHLRVCENNNQCAKDQTSRLNELEALLAQQKNLQNTIQNMVNELRSKPNVKIMP